VIVKYKIWCPKWEIEQGEGKLLNSLRETPCNLPLHRSRPPNTSARNCGTEVYCYRLSSIYGGLPLWGFSTPLLTSAISNWTLEQYYIEKQVYNFFVKHAVSRKTRKTRNRATKSKDFAILFVAFRCQFI